MYGIKLEKSNGRKRERLRGGRKDTKKILWTSRSRSNEDKRGG